MTSSTPIKLAHRVYGVESGCNESLPPIIFLHGVTANKESWADIPQIIASRTKRKTYTIDARNHGESEYTDNFNFELNAVDLLHFMDNIQASKAILVGHSMGGITAMKMALSHPERVEKIVVEDMFVKKCSKEIIETLCSFINLWLLSVQFIPKNLEPEEATNFALNFMYSKIPPDVKFMPTKEKMNGMIKNLLRKSDGGYDVKFNKGAILAAFRDYEALMSEPTGQYEGPALFIYGSNSPFCVGKEEESIKKYFPKVEMIEFEDATHSIHTEFPEKFTETILKFLLD